MKTLHTAPHTARPFLILLILLFLVPLTLSAWSYPVGSGQTIRITQPYMNYFSPMNGYHVGVDFGEVFSDPKGKTVRAIAPGEVVLAEDGYNRGWGSLVVIRHPFGSGYLYSAYTHLKNSSLQVTTGDLVEESAEIGIMGETGNTIGVHLHFMLFQRAQGAPDWNTFSLQNLGYGYTKEPYGDVFLFGETRFYNPLSLLMELQRKEQTLPPAGRPLERGSFTEEAPSQDNSTEDEIPPPA